MIKTFGIEKEVTIQVDIESYSPYHHSCDRMSPDDPEEIEVHGWLVVGKKYIHLTGEQAEELNLEQLALDEIHQDKLEMRIDQALDRDVPELLFDRVNRQIELDEAKQVKDFVEDLQKIQGGRL